MNPIALEIYRYLLGLVRDGALKVGDKAPTGTELAARFGTSKANAHAAVKELERRGIVERKRRAGTFIAREARDSDAAGDPAAPDPFHILYSFKKTARIHWDETTLKGLEETLAEKNRPARFKKLPDGLNREGIFRLAEELRAERSAGLAFFPDYSDESSAFMEYLYLFLTLYRAPVYALDWLDFPPLRKYPIHLVHLDWFSQALKVGKTLKDLNYHHVLFLGIPKISADVWETRRYEGLSQGFLVDQVGRDKIPYEKYPPEACEWLLERKGKAPVIVTVNDIIAARLLDEAAKIGLCCPEDFQLISFDNFHGELDRNITSLAASLREIGAIVARMALSNGYTRTDYAMTIRLGGELIVRKTFQPNAVKSLDPMPER